MAAHKFLTIDANGRTVREAGVESSAGAADEGKIVALNGDGKIDPTMLPDAEARTFTVDGTLADGDWVNIFNDAGTPSVRKADASGGFSKQAHGYVKAAYTDGQTATVYFDGVNESAAGSLADTDAGKVVFLSGSVPGASTLMPPTTDAYILQRLGVVCAADAVEAQIDEDPILL